jgi:hypothetical protein
MSFEVKLTGARLVNSITPEVVTTGGIITSASVKGVAVSRLIMRLTHSKSHTNLYDAFSSDSSIHDLFVSKTIFNTLTTDELVRKQASKNIFDSSNLVSTVITTRPRFAKESVNLNASGDFFGANKNKASNILFGETINLKYGYRVDPTFAVIGDLLHTKKVKKGFYDIAEISNSVYTQRIKFASTNILAKELCKKYIKLFFVEYNARSIADTPIDINYNNTNGSIQRLVFNKVTSPQINDILVGDPIAIQWADTNNNILTYSVVDLGIVTSISTNNNIISIRFSKGDPDSPGTYDIVDYYYNNNTNQQLSAKLFVSPNIVTTPRSHDKFISSDLAYKKPIKGLLSSNNIHEDIYAYNNIFIPAQLQVEELVKKFIDKKGLISSASSEEIIRKLVNKGIFTVSEIKEDFYNNRSAYINTQLVLLQLVKKKATKRAYSSAVSEEFVKKAVGKKTYSTSEIREDFYNNRSAYLETKIDFPELVKKLVGKYTEQESFSTLEDVRKKPIKGLFTITGTNEAVTSSPAQYLEEQRNITQLIKNRYNLDFKYNSPQKYYYDRYITKEVLPTSSRTQCYGSGESQTCTTTYYYNSVTLNNTSGISLRYAVLNTAYPGDKIYFNENGTITSYEISQVIGNTIWFTNSFNGTSPRYGYLYGARTTPIAINANITIIKNDYEYYSKRETYSAGNGIIGQRFVTAKKSIRTSRDTDRVGVSAEYRSVNWKGVGIAFGTSVSLAPSYATSLIEVWGLNKSRYNPSSISIDGRDLFKLRFFKTQRTKALVSTLVKKYISKSPFREFTNTLVEVLGLNESRYNPSKVNIETPYAKYFIKPIESSFIERRQEIYAIDPKTGAIVITPGTGKPVLIEAFGFDEIVKKYVIKGAQFNNLLVEVASWAAKSANNNSRLRTSASSKNMPNLQIGYLREYVLNTYFNIFGSYDVLEDLPYRRIDISTQFDRIVDYHRDFTGDSAGVDAAGITLFRQDYANAYFSEDYVGTAFTS